MVAANTTALKRHHKPFQEHPQHHPLQQTQHGGVHKVQPALRPRRAGVFRSLQMEFEAAAATGPATVHATPQSSTAEAHLCSPSPLPPHPTKGRLHLMRHVEWKEALQHQPSTRTPTPTTAAKKHSKLSSMDQLVGHWGSHMSLLSPGNSKMDIGSPHQRCRPL